MDPPVGGIEDIVDGGEVAQQLLDQLERERINRAQAAEVAEVAEARARQVTATQGKTDGEQKGEKSKVKLDEYFSMTATELQEIRLAERMSIRVCTIKYLFLFRVL